MDSPRYTCLKLEIPDESDPEVTDSIFVKGTWFASRFDLSITDGLRAWTCNACEDDVGERASTWDQSVSEYIQFSERYLGFQQPYSVYGFSVDGNGHRRLSFTFEKEGTKLEWRWKCQPSYDSRKITAGVLNFLLNSNIRMSEEAVSTRQSHERLKAEAEKCLAQSERFHKERAEFETATYEKFVVVLNSKKAKLRELRDRLSRQVKSGKLPEEEAEESTDKTETFDGDGNNGEESGENLTSTSKGDSVGRRRGRKRK